MIVPVVALPSLEAYGIAEGEADTLTTRLGYLSEVVLYGSGEIGIKVKGYKAFLSECPSRVGPFDVLSGSTAEREDKTKAVVSWLDCGARRAIIHVDVSQAGALAEFADWSEQLPASRHRLVASFRARDLRAEEGSGGGGLTGALAAVMRAFRPVVSCVQINFEKGYVVAPQLLAELQSLRGKQGMVDYVELVFVRGTTGGSPRAWSSEEIGKLHLENGVDVQCPASLELSSGNGGGLRLGGSTVPNVDAANAFIACLRTDRVDGLIATVVCDTMGLALGLVYSNSASIRTSLISGRGVYWSRSRNGLWRKGDTSGAWQELRGVSVDCDSDAIKFCVCQHGSPPAFCHLNRRNCWGGDRGIGHLERLLEQRKKEAPEGSYSKRLFEDPTLLRNKLVEEAQELAEAETKKHVAEEAADVTYFMMVRCAAAGVSFEDVEKELDMRSLKLKRRPGNAKAERIAEGDRILGPGRRAQIASLI